ncbi:LysR family transcriptional regulator [Bradyrhizobium sp. sBnM-33]|uniref:LysR family transcriptional regulator n=1 Tax=Bradyrhizobium sp. sBnM-33 TaxID=2831780 RepID=UPI001BCBEA92|nr:LysR family transcriptional regulator [Bradyrhizobium sp. sBnM-33]WOH53366.1 LysR family transcriptional regulator [Bradyrhizobium sp. sBnM-33]
MRGYLDDLRAFKAVGRERSFTKAAAKLGVSQSALSHTIREFEGRLGVRLLTRNTRGVNPTEAGERLLRTAAPRLDEIEAELAALFDETPAATIRITAGDHPVRSILWPKLAKLLRSYPDIKVEINLDNSNVDIVDQRYDAGVRLGEQVAKDMIAVRIGPEVRFAAVGSPSYFADRPLPVTPSDLINHKCINLRLPTYGGLYAWEFQKDGHEVKVRAEGQLIFNGIFEVLEAAVAGFGVAYVPDDLALPHIAKCDLMKVLDDWCAPWPGYHLYYPISRQSSAAFDVVVDALRHRE